MGIVLTIGEAELYTDRDEPSDLSLSARVAERTIPGVGSNRRGFSYTGFSYVTAGAGLSALFPTNSDRSIPRHLLPEHPGCARLEAKHLELFREGLARYCAAYPEDRPEHGQGREALEWLVRLTAWALENCKMSALYNR